MRSFKNFKPKTIEIQSQERKDEVKLAIYSIGIFAFACYLLWDQKKIMGAIILFIWANNISMRKE
jgi:hypothetical protein